MDDSRSRRIADRADRIRREEAPAAPLTPEEAETVRANEEMAAAARGDARPEDPGAVLRPDRGELPPAD